MNNEEFLQEALSSHQCPPDFIAVYNDFIHYQKDAVATLDEFHRVCESNGIPYQLAYGSLLGAVRENGQIPWDYDIDVFVKYSDKNRIIEALNSDMSNDFYYQYFGNVKEFQSYMIRVAPKKYDTESVHVDIFFTIGAPSDYKERKLFKNEIKQLCTDRSRKKQLFRRSPRHDIKTFIYCYGAKLRRLTHSLKRIDSRLEYLCSQYDPSLTNETVSVCAVYRNVFEYNYNELWDTKVVVLDNGKPYRINSKPEKILEYIYGDYASRPAISIRIQEVYHYYDLLKWLDIYRRSHHTY